MISIIILAAVLLGMALRKYLPGMPRIWFIIALGALAIVITQQLSLLQALWAINWNIIGFLVGVFIISAGLDESGLIDQYGHMLCHYCRHRMVWLLVLVVTLGLMSALLMNDALAVMITPLLLRISKHNNCSAKPWLLASAFAITIGSVMSPIGNPQNVLIAVQGHINHPFLTFIRYLAIPTLFNLAICWLLVVIRYRAQLNNSHPALTISRPKLTTKSRYINIRLCYVAITLFGGLMFIKIVLLAIHSSLLMPFSVVSLLASIPIIVGSRHKSILIKNVDWGTIIFFVAMFIVMQSVWNTGSLQSFVISHHYHLAHPATILSLSIVISQIISNVPFVALYIPMLAHMHASTLAYMLLAAGSTIAGTFLPFGAASNMIILQTTDRHENQGFSLFEFMLIGVPLGCINIMVYYWWLH